jgi:hypothetical protein
MVNCYIVDGVNFNEEYQMNSGKEFYMGSDKTEALKIYNILINKIEPEYSELTEGINYLKFYINGTDMEEINGDN